MKDYIVRASAAHTQIRAFAAVTTEMVEEARQRHGTSPVATAALGRLLTGGGTLWSKCGEPKSGLAGILAGAYSSMISVAIFSRKVRSCSTKSMEG